ncbi:ATP-binding cassette domain-containing protein [Streptomyces sp. NPDC057638]|uniref:ATP-binding cassette domain-containing protein n=1 Tax=Streptomyces sp. NPDC057638 TaxID=3346190 RepID=UPI0036BFA7FD
MRGEMDFMGDDTDQARYFDDLAGAEDAEDAEDARLLGRLDDVVTGGTGNGCVPALRGVNLGIRPGSFLAVMGGPASGKATLARCLTGDVRPVSGTVWWAEGCSGRVLVGSGPEPDGSAIVARAWRETLMEALAEEPDLLVVDQPVSLGDGGERERAVALREMVTERGLAVVMVTGDAVVAAQADVVLFLKDGRIVDALAGAAPGRIAACGARVGVRD